MLEGIVDLVKLPFFEPLLFYLTTLFGAAAMYVFSLSKGFQGAVPFLKKVMPGKADAVYFRLDTIIVIIAGSIIGTIFFNPTSALEALGAGFGWVGAINILMGEAKPALNGETDGVESNGT